MFLCRSRKKKKDKRNCACHRMVPNCLLKMLERTPKLNFTNDQVVGYDTRRSPPTHHHHQKKEKYIEEGWVDKNHAFQEMMTSTCDPSRACPRTLANTHAYTHTHTRTDTRTYAQTHARHSVNSGDRSKDAVGRSGSREESTHLSVM